MKSSTNLVQNNEARIVDSIRTNYILVQVEGPKTYFDATSLTNWHSSSLITASKMYQLHIFLNQKVIKVLLQ